MYPTTVLPRDFLMARILRRRIARHTPSAMSRRDTASEINQWLKLGLNAAQIGERLIPDDPTMTKEQMHAIIRARMAGADAPPSAARRVVDTATGGYNPLSQTGPTLSGAPAGAPPTKAQMAAYQDAIALGQSAAGGASSRALPTPQPLTPSAAPVVPAIQAPTQEQIERQADQVARKALADAAFNASLADTGAGQTAAAYAEGATLTPEQEMVQAEREIIEGRKTPLELLIEADPEAAAVQPESLEALVEAARPESLKARAEAAMKRLAVEAPSTATSADDVIDMYDKLVEASGPRGFFERLGFGMGARMDAVNKAFMANLNKSPLARKGSGAELKAATALVLQEARRVEAARKRTAAKEVVTAANKEWDRRLKAKTKAATGLKKDAHTKNLAKIAYDHARRRVTQNSPRSSAISNDEKVNNRLLGQYVTSTEREQAVIARAEGQLEAAMSDPVIATLIGRDENGEWKLRASSRSDVRKLEEAGVLALYGTLIGSQQVIENNEAPIKQLQRLLNVTGVMTQEQVNDLKNQLLRGR